MVFEKLDSFLSRETFSVHTKTKSQRFQIPAVWKGVFEKLCFVFKFLRRSVHGAKNLKNMLCCVGGQGKHLANYQLEIDKIN